MNSCPLLALRCAACSPGGIERRCICGFCACDRGIVGVPSASSNGVASLHDEDAVGRLSKPLVWASGWHSRPLVVRHLLRLASPLVLVAVVQALMQAQIPRAAALKLIRLLLLNTTVAILIGLAVANVLQPGKRQPALKRTSRAAAELKTEPVQQLIDNVPQEPAWSIHR